MPPYTEKLSEIFAFSEKKFGYFVLFFRPFTYRARSSLQTITCVRYTGDMKTNAMRILDGLGLGYEVLEYPISDETNEDIALYSARVLGLEPEVVYKTIIMENSSREHFVFCLPAGFSISLKKARAVTGSAEVDLMKTDKLLALTGYVRGGVSPLGMKRRFPTFICDLAQLEEYVYVSGGLRGVSLKIKPQDLAKACDASFSDFVQ